jgi:uroporphyrinogen-III synthase
VRKYGGRAFSAPALAELPDIDTDYISSLLQEWEGKPARAVIFQTGVGTKALFETTDALGLTETLLRLLSESLVVARGPKSTAVLRSRGVRIDLSAKDPYTSVEVLDALVPVALNGGRVIVQRYGETNVELDKVLEARGATVIEIPTYRWAMPTNIQPLVDLMDALTRGEIDAVAFTSVAQARNLFTLAEQLGRMESLKTRLNKAWLLPSVQYAPRRWKNWGLSSGLKPVPPNWDLLCRHLTKRYPAGRSLIVRRKGMMHHVFLGNHFGRRWLSFDGAFDRQLGGFIIPVLDFIVVLGIPVNKDTHADKYIAGFLHGYYPNVIKGISNNSPIFQQILSTGRVPA